MPASRLLVARGVGEKFYAMEDDEGHKMTFTTVGVNGKTADDTAIGNLADWSEHHPGTWTLIDHGLFGLQVAKPINLAVAKDGMVTS